MEQRFNDFETINQGSHRNSSCIRGTGTRDVCKNAPFRVSRAFARPRLDSPMSQEVIQPRLASSKERVSLAVLPPSFQPRLYLHQQANERKGQSAFPQRSMSNTAMRRKERFIHTTTKASPGFPSGNGVPIMKFPANQHIVGKFEEKATLGHCHQNLVVESYLLG